MALIGINYTGGKYYDENDNFVEKLPVVYNSVELKTVTGKRYKFQSGNFIKDWYNAKKKFIKTENLTESFYELDTVDNFINDDAPYDRSYLKIIYNTPTLFYENIDNGWLFFVPKGERPSWVELKKMCE